MGTTCRIEATAHYHDRDRAKRGLVAAEAALRRVEALMSTYLLDSELARLNAADAGKMISLSPQTLEVLRAARELADQTRGAFDATCRPVIELWKRAGRQNRLPEAEALAEARQASTWDQIELRGSGAVKRRASASVDLGGIAKGYGIDRAVAALRSAGCAGGLVDVGGDIRCFGKRPGGGYWTIGVRNPFRPEQTELVATLRIPAGAVCTSGNYFRFVEIGGSRYSHIIDPRTGKPADAAPSVTVVAPTATTADAWATALSVLGTDGLKLLPTGAGIEAMLIVGTPDRWRIHMTKGFRSLLAGEVKAPARPPAATEPSPAGTQ